MRVECLLAQRLRLHAPPLLPAAETEPFACVAVIDISGYTKLTDRLAALGGIDRIKDVLNPPFELIINAVHRRLGSVIKLAGDSAIVLWTIPPKLRDQLRRDYGTFEEAEMRAREIICGLAVLACMELLELFQNYQIHVTSNTHDSFQQAARSTSVYDTTERKQKWNPNIAGHPFSFQSSTGRSTSVKEETMKKSNQKLPDLIGQHTSVLKSAANLADGATISTDSCQKNSELGLSKPAATAGTSFDTSRIKLQQPSNNPKVEPTLSQSLSIHIGLGFDQAQHIFVGYYSRRKGCEHQTGRSEYFVAGKALLDAGVMLNKGKAGQLVLDMSNLDDMKFMPALQDFADKASETMALIEMTSNSFSSLKASLVALTSTFHAQEWSEELLPDDAYDRSKAPYIEPSLLKHLVMQLQDDQPRMSTDMEERKQPVFEDNMNQYRTIATLFLRVPNVPIDCLGSSSQTLEDVQFVAQESIRVATKNGGTCRQIHADEKALSVLLVWGVEGFSHEKGDHVYAVAAAVELSRSLAARKCGEVVGDKEQVRVERPALANFSIAVTMGKAERVLCDEVIARACGGTVEFEDAGTMVAKGIEGEIQLYAPKDHKELRNDKAATEETLILEGREMELAILSETIDKWTSGDKSCAMVVGKSGFGKTQLVKYFLQSLQERERVPLICFGAARENRSDSNYVYQQILLGLYHQLSSRGWNASKVSELHAKGNFGAGSVLSVDGRSSLRISNASTNSIQILEDNARGFLQSLGIPKKSIRLLQVYYPSIFDSSHGTHNSDNEASDSNDAVTALVAAVLTILDLLPQFRERLILFLDDIQVLVILTSRPKEEYGLKIRPFFERFAMFPFCDLLTIQELAKEAIHSLIVAEMRTHGLGISSVSSALLKDLIEKSQDRVLVRIQGKSQYGEKFNLPMDASAAIISTLDKMPSQVQTVLRIASVAGQFFSLSEISFCLGRLNPEPLSPQETTKLLQTAQTQGILSNFAETHNTQRDSDFSFHHYLIYQGIYGSILQSRKNELHQIYADYYQNLYESTTTRTILPALLHHLLKLPGHEKRKLKYVKLAFYAFADWNRPIEAQTYYDILQDLISRHPEAIDLNKSALEVAKEERHLALMYHEMGDFAKAENHFLSAYSVLGCHFHAKPLRQLLKLVKWVHRVQKIFHHNGPQRNFAALRTLATIFPKCVSKADAEAYIRSWKEGQTLSKISTETDAIFRLSETMEEITMLNHFSTAHYSTKPGLMLVLTQILFFFGQSARTDLTQRNEMAATAFTVATVLMGLGKTTLARKLLQESLSLFGNLEDMALARTSLPAYWTRGLIHWIQGDFGRCLGPFRMFVEFAQRGFFGGVAAPVHFVRIQIMLGDDFFGNYQESIKTAVAYIEGPYKEDPLRVGDMKMVLAYHYLSLGKLEEAYQTYDSTNLEIDPNATPFRKACFGMLRAHIEIARLLSRFDRDLGRQQRVMDNFVYSSKLFCGAVKPLKTLQPVLFPFVFILILTWLDFILLTKDATNQIHKALTKPFKSLTQTFIQTTSKGLRVFPPCHNFLRRINTTMRALQARIAKRTVMDAVEATRCCSDDAAVFLTEHWRARVLGKVVRVAGLIAGGEERRAVLGRVGEGVGVAVGRLREAGLEVEAEDLMARLRDE
ncbi:hypothetical protein HDU97_003436 [Phlyctochytrium planicorne]|nr:hypothetical protein HDU97_003436 [Phlyctochytrium planicorne]